MSQLRSWRINRASELNPVAEIPRGRDDQCSHGSDPEVLKDRFLNTAAVQERKVVNTKDKYKPRHEAEILCPHREAAKESKEQIVISAFGVKPDPNSSKN